jgi:hypothetical protein
MIKTGANLISIFQGLSCLGLCLDLDLCIDTRQDKTKTTTKSMMEDQEHDGDKDEDNDDEDKTRRGQDNEGEMQTTSPPSPPHHAPINYLRLPSAQKVSNQVRLLNWPSIEYSKKRGGGVSACRVSCLVLSLSRACLESLCHRQKDRDVCRKMTSQTTREGRTIQHRQDEPVPFR